MNQMDKEDNYESKTAKVFKLINHYRCYPRSLAKHLEKVKTYFNKATNVLAEPNKIHFKMIEGEEVFNEAIGFLQAMLPKMPFEWDEYLAMSAQEHVDDIGAKGLLLYQSSDGTEPQDRIGKYGKYSETLGENIDFGPNDALGIIVSFVLDDGEPNRPHRNNLFKNKYEKIGIAIGHHKTEFQMCVIDFAFDFTPHPRKIEMPLKQSFNSVGEMPQTKMPTSQKNSANKTKVQLASQSKEKMSNDFNAKKKMTNSLRSSKESESSSKSPKKTHLRSASQASKSSSMANPLAKETKDDLSSMKKTEKGFFKTLSTIEHQEQSNTPSEANPIKKKIVKKSVEVITITTYDYEDGTSKEVQEKVSHEYKY